MDRRSDFAPSGVAAVLLDVRQVPVPVLSSLSSLRLHLGVVTLVFVAGGMN